MINLLNSGEIVEIYANTGDGGTEHLADCKKVLYSRSGYTYAQLIVLGDGVLSQCSRKLMMHDSIKGQCLLFTCGTRQQSAMVGSFPWQNFPVALEDNSSSKA